MWQKGAQWDFFADFFFKFQTVSEKMAKIHGAPFLCCSVYTAKKQ